MATIKGFANLKGAWQQKNKESAQGALKEGDVMIASQFAANTGDPSKLSSEEKRAVAEIRYLEGKQALESNQAEHARELFKKTIALDPSHPLAQLRMQSLQPTLTPATIDDFPAVKLTYYRNTLGISCYKTGCSYPGGESYLHCAICKNLIHAPSTHLHKVDNIDDFHAIGVYRSKLDERASESYSKLIRRIKKGEIELIRSLAELLAASIKTKTAYVSKIDFITAVPADPDRLQERGCNPPSVVAMDLAKILKIPFLDGIIGRHEACHAKDLNYQGVKQNFFVAKSKGAIKDRNILIIDDVTTRGFTISACAGLLKEAGAKGIYAALLAQSETTHRETIGKMIDKEKLVDWYMVNQCKYLGPVRFRTILDKFGDNILKIFSMTDEELLEMPGITGQVVQGIREQVGSHDKWQDVVEDQLNKMKACGGGVVLLDDPHYPKYLKESSMCHPILYYKGNIGKINDYKRSIAIVGSRNANAESIKAAETTAKELGKKGWVIVSGMALGIDSAAHKGALEVGAVTVAVVGCGVDVVYPSKSRELYDQIVDKGVIISEFPFGTKVDKVWLQKRNKTIVAASHGTFVVQTADDGGAMNAVRGCKEQKKTLYTLAPKDNDKTYSGNAQILKEFKGKIVSGESAAHDIERLLL